MPVVCDVLGAPCPLDSGTSVEPYPSPCFTVLSVPGCTQGSVAYHHRGRETCIGWGRAYLVCARLAWLRVLTTEVSLGASLHHAQHRQVHALRLGHGRVRVLLVLVLTHDHSALQSKDEVIGDFSSGFLVRGASSRATPRIRAHSHPQISS
jgi:hypothetical protein